MTDLSSSQAENGKVIRVAAAVLTDDSGRVLIARRGPGLHLAGLWEFPGGKLEKGESPEKALERELLEELHVQVEIKQHVASARHTYPGRATIELIAHRGRILSGTPRQTDHDAFEWVLPSELAAYDLAPADLFLIAALQTE